MQSQSSAEPAVGGRPPVHDPPHPTPPQAIKQAPMSRQRPPRPARPRRCTDRARFFPWRPRLWLAAYDILLWAAVAQARDLGGDWGD